MTMPHLMNCGHSETGWCLTCVHELNARLETSEEETARWKGESARLLAEGRHAKACFDSAQEQAVRLAGAVDRLRLALEASHSDASQLRVRNSDLQDCLDLNNDEFARIHAMTDNSEIRQLCDRAKRRTWQTVPMIEQLEAANAECDALKRLRDELIELNDRLKVEKNEWVTKAVERDNRIAELVRDIATPDRCRCKDSPGWTAIRCCNLCGQIHKSETLDWRTGPLERSKNPSDTPLTDAVWARMDLPAFRAHAEELEREITSMKRKLKDLLANS